MSQSESCPICFGEGIRVIPNDRPDPISRTLKIVCDVCGGSGKAKPDPLPEAETVSEVSSDEIAQENPEQ